MTEQPKHIYKISDRTSWQAALDAGTFEGAAIDLKDGYIHFSTTSQVRETARLHFAGVTDLVLGEIDVDVLGAALKWEASRGGDLFPHLYAKLDMRHVVQSYELKLDGNGQHIFPSHVK